MVIKMTTFTLPGLIDVHTHLRVPGGEHKEDFASGTAAALAGGVTQILGMPNTHPPLATADALHEARRLAAGSIRCDVGLFAGASPEHIEQLPTLAPHAAALKIYLNDTYGPLRVDDVPALAACFAAWPRQKPIAMHAEKQSVAVGVGLAAAYERPVHFCHISRRQEIELIARAKAAGLPVTCEVTPHHLFLSEADAARLGPLGDMRPVLGTADDVAALWAHIDETIDCIATDHAPHTLAEKHSDQVPPGVPGLETSLVLMLTAVDNGRLSLERLIDLMHTNPRRIFNLPAQPDTEVEVAWERRAIRNEDMQTKCGWTPFAGSEVAARVRRVTLRGRVVYEAGKTLAAPGVGELIP
jgi:carbamoyl-phosphate synthase/aspartate carbamoyltransferase/dihydroorotase